MSDPMTNVAIEDVLSSIRRLVSEDARVRPVPLRDEEVPDAQDAAAAVEAAEAPAAEAAGRLVLTPALRVPADAGDAYDAGGAPVAEAEAVDDQPVMMEQGGFDAAAQAVTDDRAADPLMLDQAVSDVAVADEAASPEAVSESVAGDPLLLEPGVDDALAWEDHHAEMRFDPAPEAAQDEQADADAETEPFAPAVEDVTSAYLDDGDFIFASSRDAAGRDEAAFAASSAPAAAAPEDDLAEDRDLLLGEDEAILDEATLRELVAEIVRQELQGALGERITRNVRKLVRREIHRALTSHELE